MGCVQIFPGAQYHSLYWQPPTRSQLLPKFVVISCMTNDNCHNFSLLFYMQSVRQISLMLKNFACIQVWHQKFFQQQDIFGTIQAILNFDQSSWVIPFLCSTKASVSYPKISLFLFIPYYLLFHWYHSCPSSKNICLVVVEQKKRKKKSQMVEELCTTIFLGLV